MARTRHHTLCGSPNGRPTHKYKTVFPYRYHHGSQAGFTSHVDRKRETILRSISQAISKSDSVLGFHLTATSPPPTGSLDEIRAHNWRPVSPAKYRLGSPTRAARNGNHKINSVSHVISQARSEPNLILAFHLTATSPATSPQLSGSLDGGLSCDCRGAVLHLDFGLSDPSSISESVSEDECASCNPAWSLLLPPGHELLQFSLTTSVSQDRSRRIIPGYTGSYMLSCETNLVLGPTSLHLGHISILDSHFHLDYQESILPLSWEYV